MTRDIITKKGVRIFTPDEIEKMLSSIPQFKDKLIVKSLLYSGLRYVELNRLKNNPDWFKDNYIHLPEGSMLKKKAKQSERWVKIPSRALDTIQLLLKMNITLPTRQTLNVNLKRWCKYANLDTKGVCVKSFRKTNVSWLVVSYPKQIPYVFLNLGHTDLVSLKHYLQIPFTEMEKEQILSYMGGIKW